MYSWLRALWRNQVMLSEACLDLFSIPRGFDEDRHTNWDVQAELEYQLHILEKLQQVHSRANMSQNVTMFRIAFKNVKLQPPYSQVNFQTYSNSSFKKKRKRMAYIS